MLALLEQSEGVVQHILERLSVDIAAMHSRMEDALIQSPRTETIYDQDTN